jgi:hypothetical protein
LCPPLSEFTCHTDRFRLEAGTTAHGHLTVQE